MNRYTWRTGLLEGLMILLGLLFLFPIYIMANLSIRPIGGVKAPHSLTTNPTLSNFAEAWSQSNLGRAMINSLTITAVSVALIVLLGALAAYGLVRSTHGASALTFYGVLLGLLIPFQLTMVPMYQNFVALGAVGSPAALIVLYVGFRMPFTIFLYASFLRLLPEDYEEAAAIDGAGLLRRFFRIVFPLLRPVTGTVTILTALYIWNDFLAPLLYVSGTKFRTLPLEVYSFVGDNVTRWPLVFAALIISTTPILVAFFFLQKTLIQGFASGVKG